VKQKTAMRQHNRAQIMPPLVLFDQVWISYTNSFLITAGLAQSIEPM
jgi:hypothetical protein